MEYFIFKLSMASLTSVKDLNSLLLPLTAPDSAFLYLLQYEALGPGPQLNSKIFCSDSNSMFSFFVNLQQYCY